MIRVLFFNLLFRILKAMAHQIILLKSIPLGVNNAGSDHIFHKQLSKIGLVCYLPNGHFGNEHVLHSRQNAP